MLCKCKYKCKCKPPSKKKTNKTKKRNEIKQKKIRKKSKQKRKKTPKKQKPHKTQHSPPPKKRSSLFNTVLCIIFPDHWSESLMQIPQTGKQAWENTTLWERCPDS